MRHRTIIPHAERSGFRSLLDGRRIPSIPDSVENPVRVRVGRSLHAVWRKTVRTPWKNFRRRLRAAAVARSSSGVPVALDETTQLRATPFEGRFPPPLAQCTVVEACEYRTRLHPLSVNSTTTERMHYVDHTVHAPAMILEHLVDQYWFPAFGLLISKAGQIWRHSFLVPYRDGFLSSIKAIVRPPARRRNPPASHVRTAARAGAEDFRRASADRKFRETELRPLHARHGAACLSSARRWASRC